MLECKQAIAARETVGLEHGKSRTSGRGGLTETPRKGQTMIANVKARFSDGVLTPLEPLELEDGEEVTLHIENAASRDLTRPTPPSPDKGYTPGSETHPLIALIDRLREEAPESERQDDMPTDGAKNYKHYLYGWPKEDER